MSWDASQPTDTTKIRNLGVVIRPNWSAIERGDPSLKPWAINLTNRTQLTISDDPDIIEDSYIVYSKEETDGVAQLWGVDFNNNKTQLTSSEFQLEQNGFVLLPPSLWFQWGRATVITPEGGTFAVTFSKEFGAIPFSVQATIYAEPESDASRGFGIEKLDELTTTGFTAQSFNSDVLAGTTMGWMAIGPK